MLTLSDLSDLETLHQEAKNWKQTNPERGFSVAQQRYEERLRELAPDMTEMCIRYLMQTGSKRI